LRFRLLDLRVQRLPHFLQDDLQGIRLLRGQRGIALGESLARLAQCGLHAPPLII
jgi:hypothetical protein